MIAALKKSLAECHVKAGDKTVMVLMEASPTYLIQRAKEELSLVDTSEDPEKTADRLKLAIQLLNVARTKLLAPEPICPHSTQNGNCVLPKGHSGGHHVETKA